MTQFLSLAALSVRAAGETIEIIGRERYFLPTKMAESSLPFKIGKNGNACDERFEAVGEKR